MPEFHFDFLDVPLSSPSLTSSPPIRFQKEGSLSTSWSAGIISQQTETPYCPTRRVTEGQSLGRCRRAFFRLYCCLQLVGYCPSLCVASASCCPGSLSSSAGDLVPCWTSSPMYLGAHTPSTHSFIVLLFLYSGDCELGLEIRQLTNRGTSVFSPSLEK